MLAANNSASELGLDVTDVAADVSSMTSATSVPEFNTASMALSSDMTDANKQYQLLKDSPVLKNATIKSTFATLQNKWPAYIDFAQGTYNDYKVLGPLLINLTNSQQAIQSAERQPSASLSVEIGQYMTLMSTTGKQAASLKMQTGPDQQLLSDLRTLVSSSNAALAQTASDAAHGKSASVIAADGANVVAPATAFSNDQLSLGNAAVAQLKALEPSSTLTAFTQAVSNLADKSSGN